jgi:hypothetical protein
MTTVEANGVTLGVEHFGEAAAPLILLAGGTTSCSAVARQLDRRRAERTCGRDY